MAMPVPTGGSVVVVVLALAGMHHANNLHAVMLRISPADPAQPPSDYGSLSFVVATYPHGASRPHLRRQSE